MLRRVDRVLMRVPNVGAAVRFYRDVMGLEVIKEEGKIASLKLRGSETELVLHCLDDLPAEAAYYLVDNVRELFAKRAELKIQFVQAPVAVARGWRAAIKDPFGNVLLIVDRANEQQMVIEDGRAPGALFPGVEEKIRVRVEALVRTYEQIGRTADDLPYTPDFERLYASYCAEYRQTKPTRQEVWRQLLNLRKAAKLPKLGEARSRPPAASDEDRQRLRAMLGEDIGRRDRLPYTQRFDQLVDEFNKTQARPLSPHLVWRLVATLAK